MSELPMDIITDTLSRLPVDILLSFRCVSKSWCSVIDSSHFVKSHLNRSTENQTSLSLILHVMGRSRLETILYSVDLDKLNVVIEFHNEFKNYEFGGSCNGLLLLKRPYHEQFVLFNPCTRKYRNLSHYAIHNSVFARSTACREIGLGYDSVNDDYKVVRVIQIYRFVEGLNTEAMVYSLKSNLWKRLGDFPWFLHDQYRWGAHVNGAVHMVVTDSFSCQSRKMIVAFDVREEIFYLVPHPDFWIRQKANMTLGVLGECLCVVGAYDAYNIDIWVMADYGVKESWEKLASILLNPITMHSPGVFVNILYYSKSRNEILLSYDNKRFFWYDLKKRTTMDVRVCNVPSFMYADLCVSSLVPLHGSG